MRKIVLDGASLTTARDVHTALATALDFGSYYGYNLDALWDMLTTDVERPLVIEWKNSAVSAAKMGIEFEKIVDVLRKAAEFDRQMGFKNKLELTLL